jgi:hypothetical protein
MNSNNILIDIWHSSMKFHEDIIAAYRSCALEPLDTHPDRHHAELFLNDFDGTFMYNVRVFAS